MAIVTETAVEHLRDRQTASPSANAVHKLLQPNYQAANGPIHQSVWGTLQADQFAVASAGELPSLSAVQDKGGQESPGAAWLQDLTDELQSRRDAGELYRSDGELADTVWQTLTERGYWGLFVPQKYGGSEFSFRQLVGVMRSLAVTQSTVAGLSSVHGCIGAVNAVKTFGSDAQKQRLLPALASGEKLSAFALTEPAAGSDLAAIRTTFTRCGDTIQVHGKKVFISNAALGRTVHLVGKLDGKIVSAICELPQTETDQFHFQDYDLYPLKHLANRGLVFNGLEFPAENLLASPTNDGLAVAYHGLNYGRTSVAATATATLKTMLANLIPWVRRRHTLGKSLAERQLVLRRIGRLGGLIYGCEVLSDWAAGLLDAGYRGELECMTAKIFAAEAVREATVDILMRTCGGRGFLQGQMLGDYLHDLLVPCIYEGESEVLRLAFFGSLLKPWLKSQPQSGSKLLRNVRFLRERAQRTWRPRKHDFSQFGHSQGGADFADFAGHAQFVATTLARSGATMMTLVSKYRRNLEQEQGLMHDTAAHVQTAVSLLVASLSASDASVNRQGSARVLCQELSRQLTGRPATAKDYRLLAEVGSQLIEEPWPELALASVSAPALPYQDESAALQHFNEDQRRD